MDDADFRQWAAVVHRAFAALETSSYYQILGVASDAPQELIRRAFHRRATQLHPDRHRGTPEPTRGEAYALFKRMTEAYRVLLDPDLRRAYDAGLKEGRGRLTDETAAARPQSREDLLRTPAGRQYYRAAVAAQAANDLQAAELNLQLASAHEPGAPFLREMLADVQAKRALRKTNPSVPSGSGGAAH